MSKFTLLVRPDGKAILASKERIPEQQQQVLVEALRDWQDRWPPAIAIIDDCEVVQVTDVEIVLGDKVIAIAEVTPREPGMRCIEHGLVDCPRDVPAPSSVPK